ncbi:MULTISPECIES: helix-turn-helix transcriptional regulator [Vibrio harveyi group]|uniref:helix-turn-helix transcriptional regulator n=1 Tax=Vibrio harveyi group TaxID=717610 RepID=UPI00111F91CA|nr:AlpA family phage regulatory protein [Vibrio parahaemolyticus]EHH2497973.1 AlpA family phage regulatory protein [Vibrio parahaemolyticus]EHR0874451.1 AlpA family phage regulatory protein [Vibrio parahaemolyticus]EID4326807.1 AlpA family phage regulatory protein [Vibrio parahaemolyticus]EJT3518698.1 AlpA family phage regulatory protein [Vibrio parahaemolyticus]
MDPTEWLNIREVMNHVGLGRTSIYELMKRRLFPCPVRMGPKSVKWRARDVEAWMRQRIRNR